MSCCGQSKVIYWYPGTFSDSNTGSDISLGLGTYTIPSGSVIPGNLLENDGDYLEIEIQSFLPNDSDREFKIGINSYIYTIFSIPGSLVNDTAFTKVTLTRYDFEDIRWNAVTNFNGTQCVHNTGNNYIVDITHEFQLDFYINQSVANSIIIDSIKITKFTQY